MHMRPTGIRYGLMKLAACRSNVNIQTVSPLIIPSTEIEKADELCHTRSGRQRL